MTISQVHSPLKYIGGKSASASRILAAFPPPSWYDRYHEPCGGAAHVLLSKPHWGHSEIYNDLNDDLYNFWLQMQNHAEEMAQRLKLLPYSRKLYYEYYARLFDGSEIEPLERAVMWFYVLRSTGTGWLRESPVGWNNRASNAHSYRAVLDLFTHVQQRLTQPRVLLENRDIAYVLAEYDSPKTLHYVDPPYKGAEYYYQAGIRKYGKKLFDHEQLAMQLNHLQGYVALSYYPYPELDAWYPATKWRRLTWQQQKPSALAAGFSGEVQEATEMLLCNYPEPVTAHSLWNEEEVREHHAKTKRQK